MNGYPADVSLEKLFEDVEKELIAWTVMVEPLATVTVLAALPSVAQVRQQLTKLLGNVWKDHWLKTVSEKARPYRRKWHLKSFVHHAYDHPRYSDFIARDDQALPLRA